VPGRGIPRTEAKDLAEDHEFQDFLKMLDESRSRFVWLARAELRGEKGQKEQRGEKEQKELRP
jgi:hypothetical protein